MKFMKFSNLIFFKYNSKNKINIVISQDSYSVINSQEEFVLRLP